MGFRLGFLISHALIFLLFTFYLHVGNNVILTLYLCVLSQLVPPFPLKRSPTGVTFIGTECSFILAFQVLIAVQPNAQMQYFDVEAKTWKPLASTIPPVEATFCYCAASAGNKLYVAVTEGSAHYIYSYDTEGNVWEKQPHSCSVISNL